MLLCNCKLAYHLTPHIATTSNVGKKFCNFSWEIFIVVSFQLYGNIIPKISIYVIFATFVAVKYCSPYTKQKTIGTFCLKVCNKVFIHLISCSYITSVIYAAPTYIFCFSNTSSRLPITHREQVQRYIRAKEHDFCLLHLPPDAIFHMIYGCQEDIFSWKCSYTNHSLHCT